MKKSASKAPVKSTKSTKAAKLARPTKPVKKVAAKRATAPASAGSNGITADWVVQLFQHKMREASLSVPVGTRFCVEQSFFIPGLRHTCEVAAARLRAEGYDVTLTVADGRVDLLVSRVKVGRPYLLGLAQDLAREVETCGYLIRAVDAASSVAALLRAAGYQAAVVEYAGGAQSAVEVRG